MIKFTAERKLSKTGMGFVLVAKVSPDTIKTEISGLLGYTILELEDDGTLGGEGTVSSRLDGLYSVYAGDRDYWTPRGYRSTRTFKTYAILDGVVMKKKKAFSLIEEQGFTRSEAEQLLSYI
jgi:hypothetical protein